VLALRVAVRFLRKSPVQSSLIGAGIAVGIGVQVFLGSLIISLQQDLVEQTIGSQPQVTVLAGQDGDPLTYDGNLRRTLEDQSGVTTTVPVRSFSAILRQGQETSPLQLTAGELERLDTIYDLSSRVVAGTARLDEGDLILGVDLAEQNALEPGDDVTLVLPDGTTIDERLSATVDLGSAAANSSLGFASAAAGAAALGFGPGEYSSVELQVDDVFASTTVADELAAQPALDGLRVTEWQAENQDLLDALQAQSSSSYTIQFFVLVAVALGIASTLAISAVQKTRQIGILKAMGMKDRHTGRIFLWEAAILGVVGATVGIGIGVGLIALFTLQGSDFGFTPQWGFIAISWLIGVLVAVASSVIPARRTARLDAIEVIQSG
jgi:lipoprotein-releasing system permease protein